GVPHPLPLFWALVPAGPLAAAGRPAAAADLGGRTCTLITGQLGADHPMRAVAQINLALDEAAASADGAEAGEAGEAGEVGEVGERLSERVGRDSPWVRSMGLGRRIEYDFDPVPL
ncbi:hypothetical protein ABWI07_32695, partial [Actinomadura sp. NPDC000600]